METGTMIIDSIVVRDVGGATGGGGGAEDPPAVWRRGWESGARPIAGSMPIIVPNITAAPSHTTEPRKLRK